MRSYPVDDCILAPIERYFEHRINRCAALFSLLQRLSHIAHAGTCVGRDLPRDVYCHALLGKIYTVVQHRLYRTYYYPDSLLVYSAANLSRYLCQTMESQTG